MILKGPIRPAQLKAFHGVVDLYYDKHGRVIARSWPKASTRPNPGLMRTAARMGQAHTLRSSAGDAWKNSWQFSNMPEGRTANDLAMQNILWQLAATTSPVCCVITDLSRFYRHWLENPYIWFRTDPPWETLYETHTMYLWPLGDQSTLEPSISYSHQLFRRGDETMRRPIITFPAPTIVSRGVGPYITGWYQIDCSQHLEFKDRVAIRPMWNANALPPPTPPASLCYGQAERPLPAGGIWYMPKWDAPD